VGPEVGLSIEWYDQCEDLRLKMLCTGQKCSQCIAAEWPSVLGPEVEVSLLSCWYDQCRGTEFGLCTGAVGVLQPSGPAYWDPEVWSLCAGQVQSVCEARGWFL
jgi:hypothetical protein